MKLSDAEIASLLFDEQASDPTTPASGFGRLYIKSDGVYFIDDAGTVTGPFAESTGGGGATFVRRVRQTLTDKTSFAGTTAEQVGTEEATLDDALLPATTGVTVHAYAPFLANNSSSTSSLAFLMEISLDGGSTWNTGTALTIRDASGSSASNGRFAAATHQVTGTVTGDIQARLMVSCSSGASTAWDIFNAVIYMEVLVDV